MDRRSFLKGGAALGSLYMASGRFPSALAAQQGISAAASDRILVLVRLDGGNDGLNTVLPLDQYDNLAKARGNILIPQNKALMLNGATGLHPSMSALHNVYQDGNLAVVQAVGYPSHNQSHFRSTDIWFTASDSNQVLDSGFLGRYLDGLFPHFPEGYPNVNFPDPPSVQIGSTLFSLLQGEDASLGMAISNPSNIYGLTPGGIDIAPNSPAGHELTFVRQMAAQTQNYTASVKKAMAAASNKSDLYPATGNKLADQFKSVARLIAGGLSTRVYVVSMGGFDTHSSQVDAADPTSGNHADLLKQLSDAITAFLDDLRLLGCEDRVVGLTISEFGRRILSNASYGTDHGTSSPLFVFGKPVAGGVIGANPTIPPDVTSKNNVSMQIDFRSVYATLLQDWMQASPPEVLRVLLKPFPLLGLIEGSTGIGSSKPVPRFDLDLISPTTVRFTLVEPGVVSLCVYNLRGNRVGTLAQGAYPAGIHTASIPSHSVPSGRYICRLQVGGQSRERMLNILP